MTKKEAAKLLSYVVACMPNLQTKDLGITATIWSMIMQDIPAALAEKALVKILREKKISTLPLPGEIIEACEQIAGVDTTGENKPPLDYEAWQEVKRHLSASDPKPWSHPAVAEAVKTIGARTICESTYDMSNNFYRVYNTIVKRQAQDASIKSVQNIVAQAFTNKQLTHLTEELA